MAYSPDGRTEIGRLQRDLDALIKRVASADQTQEVSSDLNRYLCVRVCGFLERALMALVRSHCQGKIGAPEPRAFALSWLDRAPNPRAEEILRLTARFSKVWSDELERLLDSDERRTRINSLVGIRNDVSHGKNQGISLVSVLGYYDLCKEVIEWFANKFEPKPK